MFTIIIYHNGGPNLDNTVDGILDSVSADLLEEIFVCNDSAQEVNREEVRIFRTQQVGRAKAWNNAALYAKSTRLVFLNNCMKFGSDWLYHLHAQLDNTSLISPVVHTLDVGLWSMEVSRWQRFGWRWDLNLYDRSIDDHPSSPGISHYCIGVVKTWFLELGGFDEGMSCDVGVGLELAIRSWLFGGSVRVCDKAVVATSFEIQNLETTSGLARIAEVWFPGYVGFFYRARNVDPVSINPGRLDNLLKLQGKIKRPVEWMFNLQPELSGVYALCGSAAGKSIAVVGHGVSLDHMNMVAISRADVIIGVDYVGLLIDCDYVVTFSTAAVSELQSKYDASKFLLPIVLKDKVSGRFIRTSDFIKGAVQFELSHVNSSVSTIEPPFCNFDSSILTAIHIALYFGGRNIELFGCDNKLLNGQSHTRRLPDYYGDGKLLVDSDSTRKMFAINEYCLDQLGRLALAAGIPLMRVIHA